MARALFFGTPSFAVPSLDALHGLAEIVGVVCQPDRPKGRGLETSAPPVKMRAQSLGLPVTQPTKLRDGAFAEWVRSQNADFALVVAYGRILPESVLLTPRLGCVNVHASLLPKYRGAAPITWAIVNGETETGITLMMMDAGLDTGPVLERFPLGIHSDETAGELSIRLAELGGASVRVGIPKLLHGEYVPEPQNNARATLAPMLEKEHGRIDWSLSAARVHDHIRGMSPWPGAFTVARGRTLKVHASKAWELPENPSGSGGSESGLVLIADKSRVLVRCGEGAIELVNVQPEGRRAMLATEWNAGRGVAAGERLG